MPHDYTVIDCDRVMQLAANQSFKMETLAQSLQVSRTTLWKVFGGQGPVYRCRTEVAQRIADWLGHPVDELRSEMPDHHDRTPPRGQCGEPLWSVECVFPDQRELTFHARLVRESGKLEWIAQTDPSELNIMLVVESGKACGHVRIAQRDQPTILAPVWSVTFNEHAVSLEGLLQTTLHSPGPILVFARRVPDGLTKHAAAGRQGKRSA